ncbi:hypothetical protein AMECASPLE_037035 [Ameca splendens]|uniref:Uncharacterized protein n=1 Tax=Ameca splendens TaxID=208324 RepID=A0ABV0ZSL1_9TELE
MCPAQRYTSPCPQTQPDRHHRAPRPQQNPRPHTKMGLTHPARGPRPAASTRGQHPPPRPRNHTDTPHHGHCNDSPGRNIIQLSSTTTTQSIRELVTPHPRKGLQPTIKITIQYNVLPDLVTKFKISTHLF